MIWVLTILTVINVFCIWYHWTSVEPEQIKESRMCPMCGTYYYVGDENETSD